MNKVPEAVTTKFTELFAALHNATDDLKMAGAEACLIGDFSQVANINDSCRKLQTLDVDIKATLSTFDLNRVAMLNKVVRSIPSMVRSSINSHSFPITS
jgi:hypothetical protein